MIRWPSGDQCGWISSDLSLVTWRASPSGSTDHVNFVVTGSIRDKGDLFPIWRSFRSNVICINFGEAFLLTGLDVPGKDAGFPGTTEIERDCLSVRRPAALLIDHSHDFFCLRKLALAG